MPLRFRRNFKIAPGVKINFGKKSTGISFGGKRGGMSFNTRTGARVRASVPGTGLSYSAKLGGSRKKTTGGSSRQRTPHQIASARPVPKPPIARRPWFLIVTILFLLAGIGGLINSDISGLIPLIVGIVMLALILASFKHASAHTHCVRNTVEEPTSGTAFGNSEQPEGADDVPPAEPDPIDFLLDDLSWLDK